jgi:Lon protease-like protein
MNVCRLFPLTGVVLFPHVVLPLHIFEPRYRQMTEHALAGDRRIAMVQHACLPSVEALGTPAIERVACLGEILKHERLPDGRFNMLLLGKQRIELVEELERPTLYRQASYDVLNDIEPEDEPSLWRDRLIHTFRDVIGRRGPIDQELERLIQSSVCLGILTDILTHTLSLEGALKQAFLSEPDTERRAAGLIEVLQQLDPKPPRPFPPRFSVN